MPKNRKESSPYSNPIPSGECAYGQPVTPRCAECPSFRASHRNRLRRTDELSEEINLKQDLIREMARHGELPARRIRGKWRFHLPTVLRALGFGGGNDDSPAGALVPA